ncbi:MULTISPECIES: histidine kinase N-terminal 7TM domain-containing protein [Leptospira]|uniref:Putative membrane protein n=5 Tax=Leptospiraceae TaxID=170 RepID=A0A0E2AYJ9_9LEPT|nr:MULTISPECIES: histidine kinase N-terminal 7TM domain-containing protein [Leptospira]EJP15623.1 putative membrane protein [Leptospira interrogans str. FPW2026]EKO14012.1 putative membrane protein [Leptospira kirschneri str. H1]EKO25861.1 putative membrane protein [Leptospira interrogans str. UI 12621]EKO87547.1 putative membrane protein [Leptospira interrogans serovar Grippotyphosa str. Andaman]EKP85997.1 putative membrane protein [Leptospira interrogans serovar Grippotyphosa str. 2006006986
MVTAIILLFASISNTAIGIYVLSTIVRKRKEFLDFGILCILVGVWDILFAVPFVYNSSTLFWTRVMTLPMIISPLLLVRFIHSYVFNLKLSKTCNIFIFMIYVLPILTLSFSNGYISNAEIINSKLHFKAGLLYDYFVIGGALSLFYSILVLVVGFKRRKGLDRVRLVYIAAGICVWFGFIAVFTSLFKILGLPEYSFVAPIGCTLATAIWSIGIIKINLFEISENTILENRNSLVAHANILILRKVDSRLYKKALYRYKKNIIQMIIQDYTYLQVHSDLTVDEIYNYLTENEGGLIPPKSYLLKRS